MISKELCLYIDTLRQRRNINIDDFSEGIVSSRQYKRYISGQSDIPHRIFVLLSERLEIDTTRILEDLNEEIRNQQTKLEKLYSEIVAHKFDVAEKFFKENPKEQLLSKKVILFHEINHILYRYFSQKIDKEESAIRMKGLLQYPEVLKRETLTPIELLTLSLLMTFVSKEEKQEIADKLYEMLNREKLTVGYDFQVRQYVLLQVAKNFGQRKDYDKVISLCQKGLDMADKQYSHFNIAHLFYYMSLSHHRLGNTVERNKSLVKLHNYLLFIDNDDTYYKFDKLITKDYSKSLKEMIIEINKEL